MKPLQISAETAQKLSETLNLHFKRMLTIKSVACWYKSHSS
ncbi:YycC family protein [Bacillus licheniformis]|nr:YycC family protein [Bacillus licheniformis]